MERVIDRKQRLLRHAEHYLEIYKLVLFFNISVPVWTGYDPVTLIASCGSYSHWERMLAVNMTMDRLPKNLSTLFFFYFFGWKRKLYNIQGLHKKIFHGIMTVKERKKHFIFLEYAQVEKSTYSMCVLCWWRKFPLCDTWYNT